MPVCGKFVWASSSLFFFFASFFPACSVAMLHKWDLILLPWLQAFQRLLKANSKVAYMLLQEDTGLVQMDFKSLTSPATFPPVLVSWGIHGPAKLLCQTPSSFLCWGHRCCKAAAGKQQLYLPSCVTSSSIVKATKRQGSSKETREQPICLDAHHRERRNHSSQ